MNEKIRQLARQSTGASTIYMLEEEWLRFAELLVKKFDDILLLEWLECIANNDKKSVLVVDRIRDKTKTYFGVSNE